MTIKEGSSFAPKSWPGADIGQWFPSAGTSIAVITGACSYCGGFHAGVCPRVKAIEYHGDGTVRRVEFHPPT